MAMSTLANRLQKLQQAAPEPVFDFSHLAMEKLENHKIKFGKTHVGKTYRHMWENEQRWILWFSQHYSRSSKWDHREFLHYVEMKVERCELAGTKVSVQSASEQEKAAIQISPAQQRGAMPKAKAMLPQQQAVPTTVWDLEEDPELFEILPEPESPGPIDPALMANPIYPLEDRMLQMESALNRVINYIEQNAAQQSVEQ